MGKFLKRRPSADSRPAVPLKPGSSPFATAHPCLWEWLTLAVWEDGTPRETASLAVFCDDGRLKCCLTDKDAGMVAFVSGGSWEAMLASLEEGLVEGTLDWRKRKDSWGKPAPKKA